MFLQVRIALVATLALLIAVASPAAPQQKLPESGTTIDVSLVNVDVFVTDKKGRRVTGLSPDDFEIRENGRVQPITNFAEYSGDAANVQESAGAAAAPHAVLDTAIKATAAPAAKRTIVVFVERFSLPGFRTRPMFESLRRTLRGAVRPGDSAAVIFWDNGSAYTLQDFTDNVTSLEAALTEIEHQSTGVAGSADYLRRQAAFAQAFFDSLPPEKAGRLSAADSRTRWDYLSNAQFNLFRIKLKAKELQAIMRSISDEQGRKIILFATNDFGLYPRGNEIPDNMPPASMADYRTDQYREAVARTANEQGITIYPIYPVGLGWRPSSAADSRADIFRVDSEGDLAAAGHDYVILLNQTAALQELAKDTGGLTAAGSSDITALLPHVVEDLGNYYSLAYRTPATGTTRARDISVKAKNRDYVVRSRREYVEKTDVTRMHDRVIANLYRADQRGAIPVSVELGAVAKTGRTRWSVPLRIEVPFDALSTVDGSEGSFSVFVATGGVIGIMSEIEQRTQPFSAAKLSPDRKHLTYELTLTFNAATSVVSVGVLDDRTRDYGLKTVELPMYGTDDHIGGE
jgi:VWFA-related protein